MRLAALLLALVVAGCAAPETVELPEGADVSPIDSASRSPADAAAEARSRELLAAGEHRAAREGFLDLAGQTVDTAQRAEYVFMAGEAALAAEDFNEAYDIFRTFLRKFPGSPRYPEAVERIFVIGRAFCEGRATKPSWLMGIPMTDREFGVDLLTQFQEKREQHPLADDALHVVAEAQLAMSEPELAIATWEKLGALYPRSEWEETAEFRSALAFAEKTRGPQYDKRPMLTGLERLRRYAERHPTGNHVQEAKTKIHELEEALGEFDVGVAKFYLRRDRPYSAKIYLDWVVRTYPGTEAAADAAKRRDDLPPVAPPPAPPEPPDEGYLRHGRPLVIMEEPIPPPERPPAVPVD